MIFDILGVLRKTGVAQIFYYTFAINSMEMVIFFIKIHLKHGNFETVLL